MTDSIDIASIRADLKQIYDALSFITDLEIGSVRFDLQDALRSLSRATHDRPDRAERDQYESYLPLLADLRALRVRLEGCVLAGIEGDATISGGTGAALFSLTRAISMLIRTIGETAARANAAAK